KRRVEENGLTVVTSPPEEMGRLLVKEVARISPLIAALGLFKQYIARPARLACVVAPHRLRPEILSISTAHVARSAAPIPYRLDDLRRRQSQPQDATPLT